MEVTVPISVVFTAYFRYRAQLRGFDLQQVELILRTSTERYFDIESRRHVVIGRHRGELVLVAYDVSAGSASAVTIHAVTRRQIGLRTATGRLIRET